METRTFIIVLVCAELVAGCRSKLTADIGAGAGSAPAASTQQPSETSTPVPTETTAATDTDPPTGTLATGGRLTPLSSSGAMTLISGTASDAGSGIAKIEVSLADASAHCLDTAKSAFASACPVWLEVPAQSAWNLEVTDTVFADGLTYKVSLRITDGAGNIKETLNVDQFLWVAEFSGTSFTLGSGDPTAVGSTSVNLEVSGDSSATEYRAANNSDCSGATWQTYPASPLTFSLSPGDGLKTVCLQLKNDLGLETSTMTDSVTLDTSAPSVTLTINTTLGPQSTAGAATNFSGTAADSGSGLASVSVSVRNTTSSLCLNTAASAFDAACPNWINATGTSSWASIVTDGILASGVTYEVSARATDLVGNVTGTPQTASFAWDPTPPSAPSVTGTTPVSSLRPTWNWSSGGGGGGTYRLKLDSSDLSTGATETTATSFIPTVDLTEAAHTLYVQERDAVGNWSPQGSLAITSDVTVPDDFNITGPSTPTTDDTPTVVWDAANGATHYDLLIASASGCATPDQTYLAETGTSKVLTTLAAGTWYVCLTAKDDALNAKAATNDGYTFDVTAPGPPVVSSVSSSKTNGVYKPGAVIDIRVTFDTTVLVTGVPQLTLATSPNRVINYASGSNSTTLVFNYTVQFGDRAADLDYLNANALSLNSGTIRDGAANDATLTLANPGDPNSLGANKAIVVAGEVKLGSSGGATSDYLGESVGISGTAMVVGAYGEATETGAAYVFRLDPSDGLWKETKLTASDGQAGDRFGWSSGISANTVVVGSYGDDASKGSAYVFSFDPSDNLWKETKLTASGGGAGESFGYSVAVSGNTVAVGAFGDSSNAGAVYIHRLDPSDNLWKQTKLTAAGAGANDNLGYSIAVSGNTVVAGAHGAAGGNGSASIFQFDPSDNLWKETVLTASDGANGDRFGFSCATDGNSVVIGADGDELWTGAAYLYRFDPSDNQWKQTKLTASDGVADDQFGYSAAVSGNTVVIGSATAASFVGASYVFRLDPSDNGWKETKLTSSDSASSQFFGWSAAVHGTSVVIGAHGDKGPSGSANYTGAVYLYEFPMVESDGETKLVASDAGPSQSFGLTTAIHGTTIVTGAQGDGNVPGSAYIYRFDVSDSLWKETKLTASDGVNGDRFGISVAVSGNTVVVGAYGYATSAGAAYVYRLDPSDNLWKESKLVASDATAGDSYGWSVAVSGNTVAAGAYGDASSLGAVYVNRFDPSDNQWKETKLTATDGVAADQFGSSVAVTGNTLVVGAHGVLTNTGAAYIYRLDPSSNLWHETKLTVAGGSTSDRFGWSCAASGHTVVIGARNESSSTGAAYVYRFDPTEDLWRMTKLTASNAAVGNRFGYSVGVSGSNVIVGADSRNGATGAAYVYRLDPSDNLWKESTIIASDGAAGDRFGASGAIDGNTLVFGAYGASSLAGAAYVYKID